jgi:hypothetical protein
MSTATVPETAPTQAAKNTAPKAKAAAKKKPAAAPKVELRALPENGRLPINYRQVLGALSLGAARTLTRPKISEWVEKTGISGTGDKLFNHRVSNETNTYRDLVARKWLSVTPLDVEGVTETVYAITPAGREALKKAKEYTKAKAKAAASK